MKIAILGAGFAGLATASYLLLHSHGRATIDVFDPHPIGGGVSGLSAGLLHPFTGKRAEKIWNANKLLLANHNLLTEASRALGRSVILSKGILRPAVLESQIQYFKVTAEKYPRETQWLDQKACMQKVSGLTVPEAGGGLYIHDGLTIDVKSYLEGLWQMGLRFGLQYLQKGLSEEEEFKKYDKVVFGIGMGVKHFPFLSHLQVYPVKGQMIKLKWPENTPPLPFSLVSEGYIVMDKEGKTCMAGATFERKFFDEKPDISFAAPFIKEKIVSFFPALKDAQVLECRAGVRAACQNSLFPLVGKVSDKYWYVTGLGSKGLLFHGFIGDILAKAILNNDPSLIPDEMS